MFGVDSILENGGGKKNECYYNVLGCSENANEDQILTEYKLRAFKCHPDKNIGDENALEEFQKLQEARNVLTNPEKRRLYDKWRNSDICIPFTRWVGMGERMQTTMHWAKPKGQTMLEGSSSPLSFKEMEENLRAQSQSEVKEFKDIRKEFHREGTSKETQQNIYRQFRDYKI